MVLELLVAMIAHLGEGDLTTTYDMVVPWLGDPGNPINQKRAYQVLITWRLQISNPLPPPLFFIKPYLPEDIINYPF